MTDPIDNVHAEALALLESIRSAYAEARARVAAWQPAPPPTERNTP